MPASPSAVSITLDQWYEARFKLSDRELQEVETGRILPMAVDEGIKSLANNIDSFLIDLAYKRAYATRDNSDPFVVADLTAMRKLQNVELAPVTDRRFVMDPTIEEEMLRLAEFRDLDKTGEYGADPRRPVVSGASRQLGSSARVEVGDVRHGHYASLPEVFSSWDQASSPNLPFHSL